LIYSVESHVLDLAGCQSVC